MKRGPKPKIDVGVVSPIQGIPPCPKSLKGEAKEHWAKLTAILDQLGILSTSDADAIEIYCSVFARWRKAERMVALHGEIMEVGENGYQTQNPWLNIANGCIKQLNSLMGNMGLSPAARAKVNGAMKDDTTSDKWKGLIA